VFEDNLTANVDRRGRERRRAFSKHLSELLLEERLLYLFDVVLCVCSVVHFSGGGQRAAGDGAAGGAAAARRLALARPQSSGPRRLRADASEYFSSQRAASASLFSFKGDTSKLLLRHY